MNRSKTLSLFAASVCVLALAACGGATATTAPTVVPATIAPTAEQATTAPAATEAPAEVATTAATEAATEAATTAPTEAPTTAPAAATTTKINLNSATDEEILTVPNTGRRMLREFKEYRLYTSILQFRQEIGKYVDAATIAEYEKYVYVPIDINTADAATLMQTGIDQAAADAIIAARPFADKAAFVAKLGEFLSGDALTAAEAMVAQ